MTEIWRAIPWASTYEVSSLGQARRRGRLLVGGECGRPGRHYRRICIRTEGKSRQHLVHRLVWEAFNGPIPVAHQINHIDGNGLNNRLTNLEAVTPSENIRHAFAAGLKPIGDAHPARLHPERLARGSRIGTAKLTEANVRLIKERLARRERHAAIAADYNISSSMVSLINRGKWWRHVTLPQADDPPASLARDQ